MKPLFLMQTGNQLIGIDKTSVIGIAVRNEEQINPVEEDGTTYLPLPHGKRAVICDLPSLTGRNRSVPISKREHYLILAHDEYLLALTMSGKGRMVMADVAAAQPLPPAFPDQSRELIPGALINCLDLILLLDLRALHTATNEGGSPAALAATAQLKTGPKESDYAH